MKRDCLRFTFKVSLTLAMLTGMAGASAQTLFANPRCDGWLKMEKTDKLVLLNAILAPLNMAYVTRIKPAVDVFLKLDSVEPAMVYVNDYCAANPDKQANEGMLNYHAQLVK